MTQKNLIIRVRPSTRVNLESVAEAKGWKLNEAVDRAVKALAKAERLRLPMDKRREASAQF